MEALTVDDQSLIPVGYIQQLIYWIRGQRVMLDADLAKIYGVSTARLNQQVSRNCGRFPVDFMFQLTREEFDALMLQFATSKARRGGRRKLPYAFTEHGAIMLATVLNSPAAVRASVQVVRAFVQLRRLLTSHGELARKLTDLERRLLRHDSQFPPRRVFDTIRELMKPPEPPAPPDWLRCRQPLTRRPLSLRSSGFGLPLFDFGLWTLDFGLCHEVTLVPVPIF
jgi:hypothetical protein